MWVVEPEAPDLLVLQASAGLDTRLDGPRSRIPVGELKVGRVAAERAPSRTDRLADDPEFVDQAKARREGIVAFAGYPLLVGPRLVGVLAVFARAPLDPAADPTLRAAADAIAVAVDRDQAQRARETSLARAAEAELRYRSLFEGVGDAVLVADAERRYLDANTAACELLGYRRDELLRLRVEDVVEQGSAWTEAEFARYLAEGRWHGELGLRRRDGRTVPAEALATVVQLSSGPVYLSALRDVTHRHHLQRLERDFLAMVTHDIRTPLAAIKGWLQLVLRRGAVGERDQRTLGQALDQVARATSLIDDLADLVRIEAGQLELDREPTELRALVEEQVDVLQAQTARHRLRVEAGAEPVAGHWDRQRLGQVVQNLLSNAVKYSPDGGVITVRLGTDGEQAWLAVRDPGIGIPEEQVGLLFERFYRAGTTGAGGLGLGLHITKMLVDAHGGTIAVESTPGQGSTFTVSLPLSPPRTER